MSDQDQLTSENDAPEDDFYELNRRSVGAILDAVEQDDRDRLVALMEPLHAADIADLLEQISSNERRHMIALYGVEFDGEILSELDESIREEVISVLHPEVLADAVRELESDDVVDLLEDLEEPQQEAILGALDDADRVVVEQAMAYPEESAGRLMQREVVMAPEHWNVGETIDFLRNSSELPDQFYHVILIDPKMRPTGYVTLGKLMGSSRATKLVDITEESFRSIPVYQDEATWPMPLISIT